MAVRLGPLVRCAGRQVLSGWQVTGMHVAGRLCGDHDDRPDGIVDGRRITWTDFGRMIASFDGWRFRMTFGGDVVQATTAHPDASQPMAGAWLPTGDDAEHAQTATSLVDVAQREAPGVPLPILRRVADVTSL